MKNNQKKNRLYSFLRGFVYLPSKLIYPTTTVGRHNMTVGKCITVSNHLKWSDILLVAVNVPGYRHIMAKKEIGKNKFIKFICDKLEIILIDRGAADLSSIRTTVNYLKKGEGLSIFPEGTRNKADEEIQDVKAGAVMFSVKGEAPIIPIIIHSRSKAFRRNYMIIGKPFYFDMFKGKRVTPELLEEGAEIIGKIMKENKQLLDDAVKQGKIKKLLEIDRSFAVTQRLSAKTARKYGAAR